MVLLTPLALLGVLATGLADARVLMTSNGRIVASIPSQTPFLMDYPGFVRQGFPMRLTWDGTGSCRVVPETPSPETTRLNLTGTFSESIITVYWTEAAADGCEVISDVANAALAYSATLPGASLPPAKTLVIHLPDNNPGDTPLSPLNTLFYSSARGKPDGPVKGMDVAITTTMDMHILANATNPMLPPTASFMTVMHEQGPWNDVFLSVDYLSGRMVLLVASIALFIYHAWRVGPQLIRRQLKLDMRNAVYFLALLGAALTIPLLAVREMSLAWNVLQAHANLVTQLSLFLLLLLWLQVLRQMFPMNRFVPHFAVLVYVAIVVFVVNYVVSMITAVRGGLVDMVGTSMMVTILLLLQGTIFLLVAIIFAVFSIQFYLKRHTASRAPATFRALTQLARLAWSVSLLYIGLLLMTIVVASSQELSPWGLATTFHIRSVLLLARISILLGVLGVRVPAPKGTGSAVGPTGETTAHGTAYGSGYHRKISNISQPTYVEHSAGLGS